MVQYIDMNTINKHLKYYTIFIITSCIVMSVSLTAYAKPQSSPTPTPTPTPTDTPTPTPSPSVSLSGYAWSSNIGWIDFNGIASNGSSYGVSINTTTPSSAPLSGYAWSDHIGWISFNATDVAGCPVVPANDTCTPTVNMTTGIVTGWARALTLSAYDGDGWIELSGTNHVSNLNATYSPTTETYNSGVTYNNATGAFFGNAWGSDDVGWLSFNVGVQTSGSGVCVSNCGGNNNENNPPAVSISANPNPVTAGQTTTLSWSATNNPTSGTGCTMAVSPSDTPSGYVASTSLGTVSGAINSPTTYSLTCTNIAGSGSSNVVVATTTTNGSSGNSSAVSMWLNNDPAKVLANIHIHPSDHVTLNWDGTAFTNAYPSLNEHASCSGGVNSGQPIPSWTTTQQAQALDNSANVVSLSGLFVGTYSLDLVCRATVISGIQVASTSNNVTITVTNSTIHEQ
jgi:hypothetical protein